MRMEPPDNRLPTAEVPLPPPVHAGLHAPIESKSRHRHLGPSRTDGYFYLNLRRPPGAKTAACKVFRPSLTSACVTEGSKLLSRASCAVPKMGKW